MAAARAEIATAEASLAEWKRSQHAPIATPAAPPGPPAPTTARTTTAPSSAATADAATEPRNQEQARQKAMAQIESARAAWQRANLTWRQLRLDAARERLAMLASQRELARAQAVDRNMMGNDTYNIAPLRGQFSRAQQRWYSASTAARQAHDALDRASADLASAKEAYATLMRGGPRPAPPQAQTALADQPPLQLPGWAIQRSDIRRRRGLRHFLDDGASPQLRGVTMRITAKRDAQALSITEAAAPAGKPANDGKPAAGAPQGNAPAPAPVAVARPTDHPASPTSTTAGPSTTKPPASTPQGNPATAAPAARAQPANRPAPPAPSAAAKPVERPAPPASPAGVSTSGKPSAEAPRASTP